MTSTFKCIDAHTCGNPVRVIADGHPILKGANMSEKRQHFLNEFDWIRKGLMYEPRGHDMMSGSIIYPPHNSENDFAVLFIETSGCLPMCGHGTIGTVTIAIEEGLIKPKTPGHIKMETPAGLVEIEYHQKNEKVEWVRVTNVKSYVAANDLMVDSGLGQIRFDVAYGGNFYAIIDPQENFNGSQDYSANDLIRMAKELRLNINERYPDAFVHPIDPTINSVSHILWTGNTNNVDSHYRNVVFYGDKAIDRSPCGTGTSARLAQLYHKGRIKVGKEYIFESIIGSTFKARIEGESSVLEHPAIIPSIKGWARVYGHNTIIIDEDDPFAYGFQVD